MIIIPAIDVKDGKCVRLRQGRMDSSTVFHEDPVQQALRWEKFGASRIHVVDLEGSVVGKPANFEIIERIINAVGVPVQVGGGIRNEATIRLYLDSGAAAVILGTVAAKDPDIVIGWLSRFPGKIALGIDAVSEMVAVEGWTESTRIRASELAARFKDANPTLFIYTDIERDGMMKGPNIVATRKFARSTSTPVILSGGVSTLEDVNAVLPLEKDGVTGIIIGRALYEGEIDLEAAIRLAEKENAGEKNHTMP